ncbi:MAG: type II secretion system GspH family protein, partial [Muribaculaceae bacterium]|nr:type II secretion system GspH family protein [Muribaculaceae bacterium]
YCHPEALAEGSHKLIPAPCGRGSEGEGVKFEHLDNVPLEIPQVKAAFTLAEVLITLGIIGVVAAMTIPNLMTSYRKHVIETRLQKFYSTMQQVYKLSELDNDGAESWDYSLSSQAFFNKYYKNYLKGVTINYPEDERFVEVRFMDGSMLILGYTWCANFYPTTPKKYWIGACSNLVYENTINRYGKDVFHFCFSGKEGCFFYPGGQKNCYPNHVTNNENIIINNCKSSTDGLFCTELIRSNGWKFPKNYPIKI